MLNYLTMIAAALSISTVVVPTAASASDGAVETKQADAPKKEKKICRIDDDTGSVRTVRICHTREEWSAIDEQNARNARTTLSGRSGAHDGPGM